MSSQRSACHHGSASRALAQRDVGDRGLKGGPLYWRGASCPGKDLAGAAEAAPARVLPGETTSSFYFFVFLALALPWLSCTSVLPQFTSPVMLREAVGAAPTVRAQVKGYKGPPLLLYTDTDHP